MIGKMYRPLKILNIPGKRGFNILNKYKSNFGGTFNFETNIYLNYNAEEGTEVIQLECKDLTIPVYMEEGHRLSEDTVITTKESRKIESLRKLVRPTKISSKEILEFVMLIESGKEESENDVLEVSFLPFLVEGVEHLKIEVSSQTPVVVHSDSKLTLVE